MQLSTRNGFGTVNIATGTNRVVGTSALADWHEATAGSAGSYFVLADDEATVYGIQALEAPDTPTASGQWELLLDGVFSLPSVVAAPYVIHKDFTPRRHLPLFGPSDVQRSQILNRAMWILDAGESGVTPKTALDFATLLLPKPLLIPRVKTVDGSMMIEWLLLEASAPDTAAGDYATVDDPGARLRPL